MTYTVIQYIKFLLNSSNHHSVHSPFVYNLITKCFYDKTNYAAYKQLKRYKQTLLKNTTNIEVSDLGAGSKSLKSNKRSISKIAKNVSTSKKRAKLLFRLVNYLKPNSILELGTSLGVGTQAMRFGNTTSKITTIEGCPNISKFSKENFNHFGLENIEILTGNFSEEIQNLKTNTYNLIFFDGNHQKKATLNYFETLLQTAHNDSVFVFDDIYWSKGMTEAWKTIIKHPKVTVSIDTFFWGFIFFRKEQNKEHFTIRL